MKPNIASKYVTADGKLTQEGYVLLQQLYDEVQTLKARLAAAGIP